MDRVGLLQPNATFIELGAGRGMLSLALVQHLKDSAFVLIDRAHTRGKADHFIGKDAATIMRAKIDIRHLNFAGMRELENRPLVCMSKHLCGVATDLSLRAIASTLPTQPECGLVTSDLLSSHFEGLAVALCCHHVCSWKDYVNPEFFLAQGFQASEFALVASMTSWGTCGMSLGGDVVEYLLGIRYVPSTCMVSMDCTLLQYFYVANPTALCSVENASVYSTLGESPTYEIFSYKRSLCTIAMSKIALKIACCLLGSKWQRVQRTVACVNPIILLTA